MMATDIEFKKDANIETFKRGLESFIFVLQGGLMQVVIRPRYSHGSRALVFSCFCTSDKHADREREKKKRGGTRLPLHVYGICNSSGTL